MNNHRRDTHGHPISQYVSAIGHGELERGHAIPDVLAADNVSGIDTKCQARIQLFSGELHIAREVLPALFATNEDADILIADANRRDSAKSIIAQPVDGQCSHGCKIVRRMRQIIRCIMAGFELVITHACIIRPCTAPCRVTDIGQNDGAAFERPVGFVFGIQIIHATIAIGICKNGSNRFHRRSR